MKKRIKLLTIVMCSIVLASTHGITTYACVPNGIEDNNRATHIVTKYRVYKGRHQYRRWNETLNKWVDDHWIDL